MLPFLKKKIYSLYLHPFNKEISDGFPVSFFLSQPIANLNWQKKKKKKQRKKEKKRNLTQVRTQFVTKHVKICSLCLNLL